MTWRRRGRYTTTPSRVEVDVRAIPILPRTGWRLLPTREVPLVGTVPKGYLAYGVPKRFGRRDSSDQTDDRSPLALASSGYIAKKGRFSSDARECVTEEIISKIGEMLPVRMAASKLVRLSNQDVRFLSRNFVEPGRYELRHGIELAAMYFETTADDVRATFRLHDKQSERTFYTVENMLTILRSVLPVNSSPGGSSKLEAGFAKLIAFDAVVGAPDRHAMNWGVLVPLLRSGEPVRFAPIFDTARGLFSEMSDAHLLKQANQRGRTAFLERYAQRSFPILGTDAGGRVDHFELVACIARQHRESLLPPMKDVIEAVHLPEIERMLQRRFRRIITQTRIRFILDLLAVRIGWLRREIAL